MFSIARFTTATNISGILFKGSRNNMLTRSQAKFADIKNNFKVKQDKNAKIFYADIDKQRAVIEYEEDGKVLKLMETKVPKELEGRGIGKLLAKETFEQISQTDIKVETYCDFLRHFIERYGNKYKKIIVN